MTYRGPHRIPWEEAEPSPAARLSAALMHLAYYLDRDEAGDAMRATLSDEIAESLQEGTPPDVAEGIERAMKDNLDADYASNPLACLSYIGAAVHNLMKKGK